MRAQIEARTPLGTRIESNYTAVDPVPDDVILGLLLPHVRTAGGFALDDFPASLGQAEVLDLELEERSAGRLHHVISLEGPSDDELVERVLGGRVHSRATDVSYHLKNDPAPRAQREARPRAVRAAGRRHRGDAQAAPRRVPPGARAPQAALRG